MSVTLGANGNTYSYPQTDDTLWGDDATNWASGVSAALSALGLGATVNSKAVTDIISTTKGILIPRMTTVQRDAIATPPTALFIYNTTTNEFNLYTGSAWFAIPVRDTLTTNRIIQWDGSKLVDSPLTASGSDLTISGNFTAQIITANTRFIGSDITAASSAGILFNANGGADILTLGAGGGNNATFEGGVNIKGITAVGDGTITSPGLHFEQDTNTGLYRPGADIIGAVTGGQERFRVDANGRLYNVYDGDVGTNYRTTLNPGWLARAFLNLNGITATTRASGNVSSITDHGVGEYSANFATAMPDTDYCFILNANLDSGTIRAIRPTNIVSINTGSLRFWTSDNTATLEDMGFVRLVIYR